MNVFQEMTKLRAEYTKLADSITQENIPEHEDIVSKMQRNVRRQERLEMCEDY